MFQIVFCILCIWSLCHGALLDIKYSKTNSGIMREFEAKNRTFRLILTETSRCTYTGFDLNAARESTVLFNNCSEIDFMYINRAHHQYLYHFNRISLEYEFLREDEVKNETKNGCYFDEKEETNIPLMKPTGEELNIVTGTKFKYVNLYLVTDHMRYETLNSNENLLISSTINVASIIKMIYNSYSTSEYYIQVRIAGIKHLYKEPTRFSWEMEYASPIDVLYKFQAWATANGLTSSSSTVLLLTGANVLSGSTIGIAGLSSYCKNGGGVAVSETLSNDAGTGKTAAHELGHTIGMRHINNYVLGSSLATEDSVTDCMKVISSVMSPIIYGTNFAWDRCSNEWFKLYNQGFPYKCLEQHMDCTYSPGYVGETCFTSKSGVDPAICGNTIVENGEECDCGKEGQCTDSCCDPNTCKLIGKCSPSMHECCSDKCEPAPKTKICREKKHDVCDLSDFCDGKSIDCPEDKVVDHVPCIGTDWYKQKKLNGMCYNGDCLSHEIQCLNIRPAYGYQITGDCPRGVEGSPACKKLFCSSSTTNFCVYQFLTPSLEMVKDGTPCGDNAMCFKQECIFYNTTSTKTPSTSPTIEQNSIYTRSPSKSKRLRRIWKCSKRYKKLHPHYRGCYKKNK